MHASHAEPLAQRNGRAASHSFWEGALAEHGPWLKQVIRLRVGEPQAVDEIWQEIACHAIGRSGLQFPTNVAAWLYRTAVRQALLFRRKAGRQRKLLERYGHRANSSTSDSCPLSWLMATERHAMVRAALDRLPVRDAQVLVLKYSEDRTYQEIATHLGASASAIEARLHRARQRLRNSLVQLDPREDDK